MSAKNIPIDYVTDLCVRIGQGERPQKINELSSKEFIRQMLPHVKIFLAQGYTYKEIANFFGHISSGDLKKALAKEDPTQATRKKLKAVQAEKTAPAQFPGKKSKKCEAPQPGV